MKPTLQYISRQFAEFNDAYFNGELPRPAFALGRARTVLGQFSCRRLRSWFPGRRKLSGCTIRMSTYYDLPERECQNVLLHEMIHYYIAYKGIRDTSPHGRVFRSMMEHLNNAHGWGITVRTDTRRWAKAEPARPRQRLVLALTMADGRCFLSVVNRKYCAAIEREVLRNKAIASHRWVLTADESFSDYPTVRTLRARRVSRETYLKATGGAPPKGTT